jgi:hypothetical protein
MDRQPRSPLPAFGGLLGRLLGRRSGVGASRPQPSRSGGGALPLRGSASLTAEQLAELIRRPTVTDDYAQDQDQRDITPNPLSTPEQLLDTGG